MKHSAVKDFIDVPPEALLIVLIRLRRFYPRPGFWPAISCLSACHIASPNRTCQHRPWANTVRLAERLPTPLYRQHRDQPAALPAAHRRNSSDNYLTRKSPFPRACCMSCSTHIFATLGGSHGQRQREICHRQAGGLRLGNRAQQDCNTNTRPYFTRRAHGTDAGPGVATF